jgi:hypothetical protein
MSDYPTKRELEAMSFTELVAGMYDNTTYAARFRQELANRAAKGDPQCAEVMKAIKVKEQVSKPHLPDISPLVQAVIDEKDIKAVRNLCTALLNSGWDMIDPSGKMNKTPEEVRQCLRDWIADWPVLYSNMTGGMQRLLKTFCDSYLRAREYDSATHTY